MIVAIFNQAGGVAKTTITRDLGFELAERRTRVLLLDADPQGTLGMFFGMTPSERPETDMFWTRVCSDEEVSPTIHPTAWNLDIGLSNRTLIDHEIRLTEAKDPARLLAVLDDIKSRYDWIMIDCPPKISELTVQILLAADGLLLPVQTETKAVSNFAEVQVEITKANRRRKNMRLQPLHILGVIPTLYDSRYNLHRDNLAELTNTVCPSLQYRLFPPVRKFISVAEAGMVRRPLKMYDGKCPANQDVELITDMLLNQVQETPKLRSSVPFVEVVNG